MLKTAILSLLLWTTSFSFVETGKIVSTQETRTIQLVMFDQQACEWCDRWREEIGVVYDKTTEGKQAPLKTVNIFEATRSVPLLKKPIIYTPTFVLLMHDKEVGRIIGYAGEDFFWWQLAELLKKTKSSK